MNELPQAIPDVDVLLALEPEELGAKLLFLLRKRSFQRNMFLPASLNAELWPSVFLPGQQTPYPSNRRDAIDVALADAWAWLEGQGLIVPAADTNGRNGWRILSRRAQRFASEAEFARYAVARMFGITISRSMGQSRTGVRVKKSLPQNYSSLRLLLAKWNWFRCWQSLLIFGCKARGKD